MRERAGFDNLELGSVTADDEANHNWSRTARR